MILLSVVLFISSMTCFAVMVNYVLRLLTSSPIEDQQSYEAWLVLSTLFGSILLSFFIDTLDGHLNPNGKLFQRVLETAINVKLVQVGVINRIAPGYYQKRAFSVVVYRFLQPSSELLVYLLLCLPILFIAGQPLQLPYNATQSVIHTGFYGLNAWLELFMLFCATGLFFLLPSQGPQLWFKLGAGSWALGSTLSPLADLLTDHPEWLYQTDWCLVGLAIVLTAVGVFRTRVKQVKRTLV